MMFHFAANRRAKARFGFLQMFEIIRSAAADHPPCRSVVGRLREGLETGGHAAPNDGQVQQFISPVHHRDGGDAAAPIAEKRRRDNIAAVS
ncbi:MAG TPA: hypothetical protein VNQ31_05935 [Sphingomonadaceae bacterium]|nr:hypothetical protein [Sphingomonadaceae bacterium]